MKQRDDQLATFHRRPFTRKHNVESTGEVRKITWRRTKGSYRSHLFAGDEFLTNSLLAENLLHYDMTLRDIESGIGKLILFQSRISESFFAFHDDKVIFGPHVSKKNSTVIHYQINRTPRQHSFIWRNIARALRHSSLQRHKIRGWHNWEHCK